MTKEDTKEVEDACDGCEKEADGDVNKDLSSSSIEHDLELLCDTLFSRKQQKFDNFVVKFLADFEKENDLTIPSDLKTIISWKSIYDKVYELTSNFIVIPEKSQATSKHKRQKLSAKWSVMVCSNFSKKYLVCILNENQGCGFWYAGFNDNDSSCEVFISGAHCYSEDDFDESSMKKCCDSLISFFKDYEKMPFYSTE